ncbi:D-glycero-alpha-D-manno-heptose-1,7-bisphosphate 7-phosphatase [Knoellia sp. Soil729]|uniref:D-glycero-alpha-D-manno-heptose-1,7-bisphosphate 7-phosphatase n=1 Tax=Knoellia sp. Soil729 TaxID=1736394 RepID=UPI00138F24B0|nr:HAD-IIIA family hydrolase [Knoellia sp. Soil729]
MGGAELTSQAQPEAPWDIVFLDRDGTINVRVDGYVTSPLDLNLLPGAAKAVARLNRSGCRVVLVTNQRGLATGSLSWSQWARVMSRLDELLAAEGAHIDSVELCPHQRGECTCRKPQPGLFMGALEAAPWARPHRCAMVGDMTSDVVPARALGMRAILLGEDAPSLHEAVEDLLAPPAPSGE